MTFTAWAGFIGGKPHNGITQDTYGPARCIQLFNTRKDARLRYQDVRRVTVTIREGKKRCRLRLCRE